MLCWNRDSVCAVWLLPGGESAVPLGCSYRNLTGNPRAAGICTFFDPGCRRLRNLDWRSRLAGLLADAYGIGYYWRKMKNQ